MNRPHPLMKLLFLLALVSSSVLVISAQESSWPPSYTTGPVSIAVRFKAPDKYWTGTLLSRRAKSVEPSLTVTAFRHEPFGKRFLGVAMDSVKPGAGEAAAKTVRDAVIGGHLLAAFTEMDAALDIGTHVLVFRCDEKRSELFVDGVLRESRDTTRFLARSFLKLYPHAQPGWRKGSDPDGGDAFAGQLGQVTLWNRVLSDAEVKTASDGAFLRLKRDAQPLKAIATSLYPPTMTDAQRMTVIDEAMPRWLAEKLAHDRWFPRFHPALPAGMMFDTRCAIHAGRYHLFPTWRSDMNLSSGSVGAFRIQHLSSSDLIHWRIEPIPLRLTDRDVCNGGPVTLDGHPQFFFLRYGTNGAPHRAVPTDETLMQWSLPEPQPSITKEGDGFNGRLDSVVFQHGGKYYLTGTRRHKTKPHMAMPLYRSRDLTSWEYIGDFYQTDTKPFNECPQIFTVGGKMVVAAFYALRGHDENYLVGRFENERFIPEAGGTWDHGNHAHSASFDANTAADGRVIGWSTISVYSDHDALDVARMGWKGMHSIPREVTLRADSTLALNPAKEIEQLRGELFTTAAGQRQITLPAQHEGQFELSLKLDTAKPSAVKLATSDGFCIISFDPRTKVLACDLRNIPKRGADFGKLSRTPALSIAEGQPLNVRIFYDRSVLEVYADGNVITSRLFPDDPASMKASITGALISAEAWKLNAIFYGVYDSAEQAKQLAGQPVAMPEIQ